MQCSSCISFTLSTLADCENRIPDPTMWPKDDEPPCEPTQDIIILSDDDDSDIQISMTHPSTPSSPTEPTMCMALCIEFPPGQTPHNSYLFTMHDANMLPWDIEICCNILYLHAWGCFSTPMDYQGLCRVCRRLCDDSKLQGILEWIANGVKSSAPYQYWSWGVL